MEKITADVVANTRNGMYATVLGIPTLQTGVFGGIIRGVIDAALYTRFYKIELPSFLGFLAGKRFVPIVTAVSALVLGALILFVLHHIWYNPFWFQFG